MREKASSFLFFLLSFFFLCDIFGMEDDTNSYFYVQEKKVKEADQKVMKEERKSDEISLTWIVSKCDTFFITGKLPEITCEHFQVEKGLIRTCISSEICNKI